MIVNDAIEGEHLITSAGVDLCTITGLPYRPVLTIGENVALRIPNGDGTYLELSAQHPRGTWE